VWLLQCSHLLNNATFINKSVDAREWNTPNYKPAGKNIQVIKWFGKLYNRVTAIVKKEVFRGTTVLLQNSFELRGKQEGR
jgi:hypothetical protein